MISRMLIGGGLLCSLALTACHSREPVAAPVGADTTAPAQPFLPAIGFLRGQLSDLDSLPGSLILRSSHNGRESSMAVRPAMAAAMASVFLTRELSEPEYTQTTFPDSADNSIVVSYNAKADTTRLNTVDVYVDAESHGIKRLYMMYQENAPDSSLRRQLIWYTGHRFTLITTVDKGGYTTDRRTDLVVWNSKP